jgi:hypothetical protein
MKNKFDLVKKIKITAKLIYSLATSPKNSLMILFRVVNTQSHKIEIYK